MKIEPPKRRLSKLVGLVLGDGTTIGEWGTCAIAAVPSSAILYAHREKEISKIVRTGRGSLHRWHHAIVGYEIDGKKIRSLRRLLEPYEPAEALGYLVAWADWVRARGGNPGTFGGSAWSMLRASLDRPIFLREPAFDMETLRLGARIEKHVERGRYDFVSRWDITAAYPHAMSTMVIPRRYVRVPRASINNDGFAHAEVFVPWGLPFGPLPLHERGVQIFPVGGMIEGIWNLAELRAAEQSGCRVHIREAWVGRGRLDLFGPEWETTVRTGRALPKPVGTLAKRTLNTLWGTFAMRGRGERWYFPNGTGFERVPDRGEVPPKSLSLAATVAAGVRERLYREALTTDVFVLGCHTDGVLVETGVQFTPNNGGIGDWRLKDSAIAVDFLGPQMYRMLNGAPQNDGWEYVMSGMSQDRAPRVFRHFLGNDRELRQLERREAIDQQRERARVRWARVLQ